VVFLAWHILDIILM